MLKTYGKIVIFWAPHLNIWWQGYITCWCPSGSTKNKQNQTTTLKNKVFLTLLSRQEIFHVGENPVISRHTLLLKRDDPKNQCALSHPFKNGDLRCFYPAASVLVCWRDGTNHLNCTLTNINHHPPQMIYFSKGSPLSMF